MEQSDMTQEEPKIRIETREELIYLLAEAAAIEHNVMCVYLYGIWSLKRGEEDGLTPEQAEKVASWKRALTEVAVEEMSHLTLVGNLASSIGAAPHFSRPNFPIPEGYHAAGITLELFGFSHALIDHAIYLERPEGIDLHDAPEFEHPSDLHRTVEKGTIMPGAQDYLTIGHLYRGIMYGFKILSEKLGEDQLFCGATCAQIGPADAPLPGNCLVRDLESAEIAIQTIIEQGEGAPAHGEENHYQRFLDVRAEYEEMLGVDPAFEPAFPVARNPVMRQPLHPIDEVVVDNPEALMVMDLANSLYGHMLRCLVQAYGRHEDDGEVKRLFVTLARELMSTLTPVSEHLASLPAGPSAPGVNAGTSFTMLRDVARVPTGNAEMRMISERLTEMSRQAARLFPDGHRLGGISDILLGMAAKIEIPGATREFAAVQPHDDKPKVTSVAHTGGDDSVGCEEGKDMILSFDTKRCIHARRCVLGAPEVFLSGVEGQWIFPDAMETEALRGVAHSCPSGAVYYVAKGENRSEPAPEVNVLDVRENGPNAIRAEIVLDQEPLGYRATFCRCGASKNKPFCDNSHNDIGFRASGEPETRASEPLAVRDGPLKVTPQRNGPLIVEGNLEICAGTGRNIDRVQSVRLCRCGGSKTKPFCDNTHLKIGFKSDD